MLRSVLTKFSVGFVLVLGGVAHAVVSEQGEIGSGGGNAIQSPSTTKEVRLAAEVARKKLLETYYLGYVNNILEDLQSPDLVELLRPLVAQDSDHLSPVQRDLALVPPFDFRPCRDQDGNDADSSTDFRPNAPICIDDVRLSRISLAALVPELEAIIFHEVVHHLKIHDEIIAKRIQLFYHRELQHKQAREKLNGWMNWSRNTVDTVLHFEARTTQSKYCGWVNPNDSGRPYPYFGAFGSGRVAVRFAFDPLDRTIAFHEKILVDDGKWNAILDDFKPVYEDAYDAYQSFCKTRSMDVAAFKTYTKDNFEPKMTAIFKKAKDFLKMKY